MWKIIRMTGISPGTLTYIHQGVSYPVLYYIMSVGRVKLFTNQFDDS